jgi:PadR family transcriptional regulator PadR
MVGRSRQNARVLPKDYIGYSIAPMTDTSPARDLFPGALELIVLQTLSRTPMHGYALAQHIKSISDELLQIEEGSLYPALQRLLKAGWLRSKMGVSVRNRPVRIFELTAAGGSILPRSFRASEECLPASIVCSLLPVRER